MTWFSLLLIDIIYSLQFILFMQWYYPQTIMITGHVESFMLYRHIVALLQLITCYILVVYNVRKASKE